MKKAIIVLGSHFSGKSKTINVHLKPKLKLSGQSHIFSINKQKSYILSQSFEEADRDVNYVIEKCGKKYHYLVLASRPVDEKILICQKQWKNYQKQDSLFIQ